VLGILAKLKEVEKISAAGSLRRLKETIGDIDILVAGEKGEEIIRAFTHLSDVLEVLAEGATKGSVVVAGGHQIDLRVVPRDAYGAALQYFTGSKAHNIRLRSMARDKGLKLSEYGVFKGKKRIAGKTEEDVYGSLGLPWVPPELREDRGEIEAAARNRLPTLVKESDVKGDLHVHSRYSDGSASIEEMAKEAKRLGYSYIAICDHSTSVRYAGGLSRKRLLEQIDEIAEVNKNLKGIRVLSGAEVDILQDGSLDYPDDILERLEFVVAAIHMGFKRNCTERMEKAMENPHVDAIAHPTGRLISSREGYLIEINRVIDKAAETHTALEINAYYDRLDLNDVNVRRAKECGVKLSIGTDAHHPQQLWMMKLGVGVARRGWLERGDLLNTLPPDHFQK
jgi:DNA polymerase (family 10)